MELISTTLMAQRSENAAGGFKIRKDTKKKREIADKVNDFEKFYSGSVRYWLGWILILGGLSRLIFPSSLLLS